MERYIGMDAHAVSCTLAVVSEKGRKLKDFPVETNGQALVEAIRMIPGHKHLVFEEGLQSAWLRIAGSLRPATMKSSPLCTRLRLHSEIPIISAKKTPREMPRVHFIYGLPPRKPLIYRTPRGFAPLRCRRISRGVPCRSCGSE